MKAVLLWAESKDSMAVNSGLAPWSGGVWPCPRLRKIQSLEGRWIFWFSVTVMLGRPSVEWWPVARLSMEARRAGRRRYVKCPLAKVVVMVVWLIFEFGLDARFSRGLVVGSQDGEQLSCRPNFADTLVWGDQVKGKLSFQTWHHHAIWTVVSTTYLFCTFTYLH